MSITRTYHDTARKPSEYPSVRVDAGVGCLLASRDNARIASTITATSITPRPRTHRRAVVAWGERGDPSRFGGPLTTSEVRDDGGEHHASHARSRPASTSSATSPPRWRATEPEGGAMWYEARAGGGHGRAGAREGGAMSYEARSGRGYEYGGPAFPGGILVGIGLGILLGDFFAWLL